MTEPLPDRLPDRLPDTPPDPWRPGTTRRPSLRTRMALLGRFVARGRAWWAGALTVVVLAAGLAAVWDRSPVVVRRAVDPVSGRPIGATDTTGPDDPTADDPAAHDGSDTSEGTADGVMTEVPYSRRAAGRGLDWVDGVQRDKDRLLLEPGPVGGFGSADYTSRYINIRRGERVVASSSCDCPAVEMWFVGGSAAFGTGQRDEHTIASDLVRLAAKDGVRLEARNLAVPGYALWQEYQVVLARLAAGEHPDIVVFYDGFNDVTFSFSRAIAVGPDWSRPAIDETTQEDAARIAGLGTAAMAEAVDRLGGTQRLGERIADRYRSLRSLIAEQLDAEGIASEFFFQPDAAASPPVQDVGWDTPFTGARMGTDGLRAMQHASNDVLEVVSTSLAPDVHDLRHVFDDYPDPVFFDVVHTNEAGASVVADAIHEVLRPRLRELAG